MTNYIHPALLGSALVALCASPALADHGAAGTGARPSGPIVGISATTMDAGEAAVGLELALAKPDNRSDAVLATLAGQHIHAHDQDMSEASLLSVSYGLTGDLTLSATLPYVRRVSIREGEHSHVAGMAINGVVDRGNSAGLGDAAVLAKWRFTGEHHHGWEAAAITGLELPTGSTGQIDDVGSASRPNTSRDPAVGIPWWDLPSPAHCRAEAST